MKVVLARLEGGSIGTAVLVNDTMVYHEDDDKGATNRFCSAGDVAERLGKVLGCGFQTVDLKFEDLGVGDPGNTWTFDDVAEAAARRAS